MKGWVGLVSWPTVDSFTHTNGYPSAAGQVQAVESSPITISDIPVTETQTDIEMIDISKINTEKIFNTDTIYMEMIV